MYPLSALFERPMLRTKNTFYHGISKVWKFYSRRHKGELAVAGEDNDTRGIVLALGGGRREGEREGGRGGKEEGTGKGKEGEGEKGVGGRGGKEEGTGKGNEWGGRER